MTQVAQVARITGERTEALYDGADLVTVTSWRPVRAGLLALLGLCACRSPYGATPAVRTADALPRGPGPVRGGLPFPSLAAPWRPPEVAAGDVRALAEALDQAQAVSLVLKEGTTSPRGARRATVLARALAPKAEIRVGEPGGLTALLAPEGSFPIAPVVDDAAVPPRYRAAAVTLSPRWDAGARRSRGASRVLWLMEPGAGGAQRELPAGVVGSCAPAMRALAVGQEQSLAALESFLDHADATLWHVYRSRLDQLLPIWSQQLAPFAEAPPSGLADDDASARYACGHAQWRYLQSFVACGAEADLCLHAPRLYLVDGVRVGVLEPSPRISASCVPMFGRDVAAELRNVAREAAQVARDHLDHGSTVLADRLGVVTEVVAALTDVCVPERRRLVASDVDAARRRLARIGADLASPQRLGGAWRIEDDVFFAPGIGDVRQVARFESRSGGPTQSVVSQARGLRQFVRARALCRGGTVKSAPWVAVVIDTKPRSTPRFVGYFYEEELFCDDLPPRGVETEPAAMGVDLWAR